MTWWCCKTILNQVRCSGFHWPFATMQSVTYVPAKVWRENVDAFLLGQQGMESASVRSTDHVAFFRGPEFQFSVKHQNMFCIEIQLSG